MTHETTNGNDPAADNADTWELILYLTGNAIHAQRIYGRLEQLCETHLSGHYRIEVVNLTEEPEQAYVHDIIATPTVVRRHPEPMRKVFGDLSQTPTVLFGLGLEPVEIAF